MTNFPTGAAVQHRLDTDNDSSFTRSADDPPLDQWLTKQQACEILNNLAERTLERWAKDRRIRQKNLSRPGKKPLPVYHPFDIEQERLKLMPQPKLLPPLNPELEQRKQELVERAPEIVSALIQAIRPVEPQLETPFVDLDGAVKASGLPRRLLQRLIKAGELAAYSFSDQFYIRRADLADLKPKQIKPE